MHLWTAAVNCLNGLVTVLLIPPLIPTEFQEFQEFDQEFQEFQKFFSKFLEFP